MKSSDKVIVFVLDSNLIYQRIIAQYLQVAGIRSVIIFSDPDRMYQSLKLRPHILISEYLFNKNALLGHQVLARVRKESPSTDIYFHTTLQDVDAAVSSIKEGAIDYVIKSTSALDGLVRKIIKRLKYRKNMDKSTRTIRHLVGFLSVIVLVMVVMIVFYSLF
ncbi:MAG: response regulator [Bacteroidales bacterium]|nr:response regulator [Bacteroidales bacterium]